MSATYTVLKDVLNPVLSNVTSYPGEDIGIWLRTVNQEVIRTSDEEIIRVEE